MIICICKYFPVLNYKGEKTGGEELFVDYAMDSVTLKSVIVPCEHPRNLGAKWNAYINEWVIY